MNLDRLREQLASLIESAALEVRAEVEAREAAVARAIEDATGTPAVAAAYSQGRYDREREIIALLEEQQDTLGRAGLNAISLASLKRRISQEVV